MARDAAAFVRPRCSSLCPAEMQQPLSMVVLVWNVETWRGVEREEEDKKRERERESIYIFNIYYLFFTIIYLNHFDKKTNIPSHAPHVRVFN